MIDVELECHLLLDSFSWQKIATDGFKKGLETRPQRHKHVASTLNVTDDTFPMSPHRPCRCRGRRTCCGCCSL